MWWCCNHKQRSTVWASVMQRMQRMQPAADAIADVDAADEHEADAGAIVADAGADATVAAGATSAAERTSGHASRGSHYVPTVQHITRQIDVRVGRAIRGAHVPLAALAAHILRLHGLYLLRLRGG